MAFLCLYISTSNSNQLNSSTRQETLHRAYFSEAAIRATHAPVLSTRRIRSAKTNTEPPTPKLATEDTTRTQSTSMTTPRPSEASPSLPAIGGTTETRPTSTSAVSDGSLSTKTTMGNLIHKSEKVMENLEQILVIPTTFMPKVISTTFMLYMFFGVVCTALAAFVVILVLHRRHQLKHKTYTPIPTGSSVDGALKKACPAAGASGNPISLCEMARDSSSVDGVKSDEKKEEELKQKATCAYIEQDLFVSPASPVAAAAGELLVVDVGTPSAAECTPIAIGFASPPTSNGASSTLSNEKSNQLLVTVQIEPVPMEKTMEKAGEETLVTTSEAASDSSGTKSATDDDNKEVRTDGASANNVRPSKPEPENERSDTQSANTPKSNKETRADRVPGNSMEPLKADPEAESHDKTSTSAPGESSTNDDVATTTVDKSTTALPSDTSDVPGDLARGLFVLNELTSEPQASDADKEARDFIIEGGPRLLEKMLSKT